MRPLDFFRMCHGWAEDEDRRWLHTRAVATPIINSSREQKEPYSEADLFPTMFDSKKVIERTRPKGLTPSDIERMTRNHFKALAQTEQPAK
jgi:hypothetical protein